MPNHTTTAVWEQFAQKLRYFIMSKVSGKQDVEDILQEVFIKVHQNLKGLKEVNKLESWLYQITRNAIADYYRRNKSKLEMPESMPSLAPTEPILFKEEKNFMSMVHALEGASPQLEKFKLKENGSLNYSEAKEFFNIVYPFLENIPEKYAQAVFLTDWYGLSQVELAKRLDISVSGAKSRVQRGRGKLKELFFQCCDFEFDSRGSVINYTRRRDGCNDC